MNVLGIESSCDETSVAVIRDNKLSANLISSQDFHKDFGGVVPELSSRAHIQIIVPLLKEALAKSGIKLNDIDLITATAGPGLIGALLVGLTFAKGLAFSTGKPFIGVNHVEGHIFSGFLMEEKPEFPYISLIVSGGHTLLLLVKSFTEIVKLGSTVDDAAGEAFDKVAKMIGLGYPGGPKIQTAALNGNPDAVKFPIAELKDPFNFSFSGLKTAVLRYIQKKYPSGEISAEDVSDIAASFQNTVVKTLIKNMELALNKFNVSHFSVAGGVAANQKLREGAEKLAEKYNKKLIIPSLEFCGDNAAMIAFRGLTLYREGIRHNLDFNPFPGIPEDYFSALP
ncbi:MAG: tRNA (adenosine(37)-N6)-threonylcarbamoyltransferase complex transferase subunit TsaD [Ignavibacteriales bacterium]|nr:MAG: tRNA (adenosine(37)-N6)-threonylcarbamoyltransferase complex transferase subunit TsaD [Ignavibacteriales bacterium]